MNKKIIVLAVASALAGPMVAQASEPTVYGRLHMSYGQVTEKSDGVTTVDNWQTRSHASRMGIKGSRNFGGGLMGVYKLEFEVNPDSDNSDPAEADATDADLANDGDKYGSAGLARRNQYVGLKGGWGELRVGRHDTPLKMAQGKFDQFGDTDADLKHAGSQDGENRLDNMLIYLGKSGNIGYSVAIAPGEDDGTTGAADTGPADTLSVSLNYKAGPVYIAVAQDTYENGGNADSDSISRVVGTYKTGGMQVGLLWQSGVEKPAVSTKDEDWLGLSFAMKIAGNNKIKAQYIMVEDNAATVKESTLTAIGFDHKFDKKTSAYAMYSSLETDEGSSNSETTFLGAGMILKF